MNAKEAKEIASKKLQEPLSKILTHIEKAAKSGNMSVHVYENLNDQVIERLGDLGYKVNKLPDDFREHLPTSTFVISWD